MKKKQPKDYAQIKAVGYVNVGLSKNLDKRLTDYVLKIAQRDGKIYHGIKTMIMRMALDEWLEKHGNDDSLKF